MKLKSRFAWVIAGRLTAALVQAIALVLVARQAGSSAFGALAAFMGLVVIFQTIFDFGIFTYVTRLRAVDPDSTVIGQAIKAYKYTGVLLCLVLILTACAFCTYPSLSWWTLIPLAIAGAVERQADLRLTIAIADGDVWKNTIVLVTRRLLTLSILVVGGSASMEPIVAFGLASLVSTFVGIWMSRRLVAYDVAPGRPQVADMRSIFRVSKSFWAHSLGMQARNLDAVIVAAVSGSVAAGYYGAISRSLNPMMMFSSSLSTVLFPIAARAGTGGSKAIRWAVVLVMMVVAGAYGTMAFYADVLVRLIFGDAFLPAVPGFRWVLLGLVFSSLASIQASLLQARGLERSVGAISILVSLIALGGIAYGSYLAGVTGASMALACSYALQCGLCSWLTLGRGRAVPRPERATA